VKVTKPPLGLCVLLVVVIGILVACDSTVDVTTTTRGGDDLSTTSTPDEEGEAALSTYTMGVFEEATTDNPWSYLDSPGSDHWVGYLLNPTLGAPYTVSHPGFEPVADLAAGDLEPVVQNGDSWVGTITLREDIVWSDGEPITAHDYVFTYETARDLGLRANWSDYLDAASEGALGVTEVEAIDDQTITVTFNTQPGLAEWGVGTGPPYMPILPEHFWGPIVDEAVGSDNPRDTLISASGVGAPSGGPVVFGEIQPGRRATSTANPNYTHTGETINSGDVAYEVGPFVDSFEYPVYESVEDALLALDNGEVDLLLSPEGMPRGLREQLAADEDLTVIVNPTNGYRFLGFNLGRAPMSDLAFREALAAMINKEYVTENLMLGAAFPLYSLVPEANMAWHNADVVAELAEQGFAGLDDDARRATAIGILTEAGYTWPEGAAPGWYDSDGAYSPEPAEGYEFSAADGDIIGPDGETVQTLELVHPNAGHDPHRAIFGVYIAGVAREIGLPVSSVPTDFAKMIEIVYQYDEEAAAYTSPFDMFVLGHTLGNPVFPTFHGSFFATGGNFNNTQYSSEEFDAFADQLNSATTTEEAHEAIWEMERLIARDKPHVPLFDTGIVEVYSDRVEYPFTSTLSGLQFINGAPAYVTTR
jgi:peptide/nickel transport system substrate-binding protein